MTRSDISLNLDGWHLQDVRLRMVGTPEHEIADGISVEMVRLMNKDSATRRV